MPRSQGQQCSMCGIIDSKHQPRMTGRQRPSEPDQRRFPTHARNGVRAVLMLAESERGREIGPGIPDDLLEFGVQFRLKGSLSNAEARRVKCSPVGTATPEP
jgi:hypothetical protein